MRRLPVWWIARGPKATRLVLVAALVAVLQGTVAAGSTGTTAGRPAVLPRVACGALAPASPLALTGVPDFSTVVGAPTRVLSATVVAASAALPEHCDIRGYVAPQVVFELRLPTRTWNGRYFQTGCGGFCGTPPSHVAFTYYGQCDVLLGRDYANGYDDGGHVGVSATDGLWALDAPSLREDFGYRSEHVLALAARAIIEAYYGQGPRYSYFNGCSDGGRQALMEAQRYPDDFDGIIAGAPGLITAPLALFASWKAASLFDQSGAQIFTPAKLAVLHDAVIARCDGVDGLVDGQIDDPRSCAFDPAPLRCPGSADGPTCLSAAQVAAATRLYQGPSDASGRHLYPGGEPLGSELGWGYPWTAATSRDTADNYLRYMALPVGQPGPAGHLDVRFDLREFDLLRPMGLVYNAVSADLSAFRRRGGKLIVWQGWADDAIPPAGTLDYYHAVLEGMGGLSDVQQFARVFMLPGVGHCGGGTGPGSVDFFTPLESWVERGVPPARIVASQVVGGRVVRARPVFPYPMRARYSGSGSLDEAASFVGVMPSPVPVDQFDWAGEDLYTPPRATAAGG